MHSPTKIPSAQEIAARIRNIGTSLLEVAHDLVAAIDARPELVKELADAGVNRELLNRLEKLGRGQIHPSLVFNTTSGGTKLLALPLSEQTHVLENGVEILDADETSTRLIPVNELTGEQSRQVFQSGKMRTLAEQRTWLRDRKNKLKPVDADATYRVFSDHVVVLKPGKFTKKLLLQWLTEMA